MTAHLPNSGLYAITDSELIPPGMLVSSVAGVIAGGAAIVQYRDKKLSGSERLTQASALCNLCKQHSVPFVVNDDVQLAAAIRADGVHIGKHDSEYATARKVLGSDAIIGVSCYDSLDKAVSAESEGASYVAFGRFFPSGTKPDAAPVEIGLLARARKELSVPIVAIGGITPENGTRLLEAGAQLLAVIGGLFGEEPPDVAASRYANLFSTH